ncbi:MAG: ATP phosphoribosyltransferase regulatory subunit, partial [Acidobacteria bacterium]|nr:ATP phosphoribosyltransferase regulatory subunit [Acidobacteriota bacterium]
RYQIQPVWRADRPARGRFREFYQCDVDSLGSTSPVVEAELCAAVADAMTELGFNDFVIRINHRQLLASLLGRAGVTLELHTGTLIVLDKLDKIGGDGVNRELAALGLGPNERLWLLNTLEPLRRLAVTNVEKDWPRKNAAALEALDKEIPDGQSATANLRQILGLLEPGVSQRVRVDVTLARGLSYYTGAIMEVNVPDLAGSLGGGGRYDNLIGMFAGQDIPACGFSLGLERILVVMTERGMFPATLAMSPADVMVAMFETSAATHVMAVASRLRARGLRVLVYPDAERIGKQIKYADVRGIPFVALVGDEEMKAGTLTVKDLAAQTQQTYDEPAAGDAMLEALKRRG